MEITIPCNWEPEPHQRPILQSRARFKVIVWHRKARKTTLALNELIRWAAAHRGTYWYIAPYYSQAKKIVWQDPEMLPKYCPPEIWAKRNSSELYVPFPNGSVLYVMGADKPDSLRGPNPRGVVLDEYGDMKPEVWSGIVQPIMTANPGAWCWFMGTPKGRNDFWRKFAFAGEEGNRSWERFLLKASVSGLIPEQALDEARHSTTEAFYKQEYECDFLDNATAVFRRIRQNLWGGDLQPVSTHSYQLGVDLAKYNDWTVITPFDRNTFRAGMQERFNRIDWSLQVSRVEAAAYRWNGAAIKVDSTGVGDPIAERLAELGLNVDPPEGFKFTETSRQQLLTHLAMLLDSDRIRLPDDEGLIAELESMSYMLSSGEQRERPKVRMMVPEGMTDDRIMSLALAVWGLSEPLGGAQDDGGSGLYSADYS